MERRIEGRTYTGLSSNHGMGVSDSAANEQVRTADVIAPLSLATDLGMGFPFEHGLLCTLTTMRLCDLMGVDSETASQAYYATLLTHVGCTVDAEVNARIFYGTMKESGHHLMYGAPLEAATSGLRAIPDPRASWPSRVGQLAMGLPRAARFRVPHFNAYCETAEMLADALGLPPDVSSLFSLITERWDGWSHLHRAKGDEIPLALRITLVGRDATYQRLMGDDRYVVDTIRGRGGRAFDPDVVDVFVDNAVDILGEENPESAWEAVLAAEPKPWFTLEDEAMDRALSAMGAFSDLASPYLSGHASGVANLAANAAALLGMSATDAKTMFRAGLVHDLGRAAVHPRIWEKSGPLSADEWEQVRLHPYHTGRVLARSSLLAPLAEMACSHHERIDGSGYHRALPAAALPPASRLLAAADAFQSKTEPRSYRKRLSPEEVSVALAEKTEQGKLDSVTVSAVVEAAGMEPPPIERPAGLTEREVEVIGLLARGMQTKQIARALDISAKTADRHIQNVYRKIGVSSRAAATLFATEHGLVG